MATKLNDARIMAVDTAREIILRIDGSAKVKNLAQARGRKGECQSLSASLLLGGILHHWAVRN